MCNFVKMFTATHSNMQRETPFINSISFVKFTGMSMMFTFCMKQCKLIRIRLIFFILSIDDRFFWSHANTFVSSFLCVSERFLSSVSLHAKTFVLFRSMWFPTLAAWSCVSFHVGSCDFAVIIHVYDFWIEIFVSHLYEPFGPVDVIHVHFYARYTLIIYTQSPCHNFMSTIIFINMKWR